MSFGPAGTSWVREKSIEKKHKRRMRFVRLLRLLGSGWLGSGWLGSGSEWKKKSDLNYSNGLQAFGPAWLTSFSAYIEKHRGDSYRHSFEHIIFIIVVWLPSLICSCVRTWATRSNIYNQHPHSRNVCESFDGIYLDMFKSAPTICRILQP